jgi:oxalate decarboxylase/phosphoglucose isomerase-like protein (cupin superfamily)
VIGIITRKLPQKILPKKFAKDVVIKILPRKSVLKKRKNGLKAYYKQEEILQKRKKKAWKKSKRLGK